MGFRRLASFSALTLVLISCSGGDSPTDPVKPPTPVATTVTLSTTALTFSAVGATQQLTATVKDQLGAVMSGAAVTWASSNQAVATVSASGLVTAVANGTATITATSGSASAPASVTVQQVAASMTLAPPTVTLSSKGATQQLTATVKDAGGATIAGAAVTWASSNQAVATVSSTGLVTGIASGTATITASSGSVSATVSVTVQQQVASVSISPTSLTLDVGQTATITATVRDALGNAMADKTVTWATSDAGVVGGTANGNTATLVAAGAGSASVTATVDGIVGTLPVTVRTTPPKPVASVVVTPSTVTLVVGARATLIATLRDAQGNVLTGRTVSWTTSNIQVVNGTASGNAAEVTGGAVGTATVTATSEGVSGSSVVTVISSGGGGGVSLTCAGVAGGVIVAQDGTYLGKLSNKYDTESILNPYGSYGSQFSSTSIYNQYSQYGSKYASYSAYNEYSTTPPILYVNNVGVAYVTKNTYKIPRVDPDALKACTFP